MGERWARWGFGYQDKVCTERILNCLRTDLRDGAPAFEGVRLADLEAGRVDDFVLVWKDSVEGNSIKWSAGAAGLTWGELIGASGILYDLAEGWKKLQSSWSERKIAVRLHTNRLASANRHHAQLISSFSLAEFVATHWAAGPDEADSSDVSEAWRKIAEHIDLRDFEFSDFVANCELSFGQSDPRSAAPGSIDGRHYRSQFDSLHKAIATWLTNNPRGDFIERAYLLAAIGLRPNRFGLIQHFPEPEIPYEKNHAAADRLKELVDEVPGGYLAVLGPAGVGKSSLVQDVLSDSEYPLFVPYYAFLPTADGNRDRAEALTFFQDVVARLDRCFPERLSLGVADLAQGRDALRHLMSSANRRYVLDGLKTILLIDGLDHVMREVNLQMPVLNELPPPSEIPDGFLIILSGQPQAFLPGTIPPGVAACAARESRRLEVPGLKRHEVHALVSRVGKRTTGAERDSLHVASLGNPLILTYLVTLFKQRDDTSVARAIELAGDYQGSIDHYYKERLSVPLQDDETRWVLGLLCRAAAPTLPMEWLAAWPERRTIEGLYQRVLAPFVQVDDAQLKFTHNSLIALLKAETRSRLPGIDPVTDERAFHSVLADRSDGRSCLDPVGRARVFHLLRAERYSDMLAQLSSEWLRSGMSGFLPYSHVHPIVLAGYDAATATGNWSQILRLVLLDHELSQRSSRLDAAKLADALLNLERPQIALSQIRSGGRLLVDVSEALRFAGTLWSYGDERECMDLKAVACALYRQAKPLSLIYSGERIETNTHDEQIQDLAAWSGVAVLFDRPGDVANEIQRLALDSRPGPYGPDPVAVKADYLLGALAAALDAGCDAQDCQAFVDGIRVLGSKTWHFLALLRLAQSMPSAVALESLRAAYGESETDLDTDLAYASFLHRQGDRTGAVEIVRNLPHIRFELGRAHSWGFSDVTYTIRLRWLQELLGISEGAVPGATDEREEPLVRAEQTARELGSLMAQASTGRVQADRHALFRSVLLFHNRPVHFSSVDSPYHFILQASRNEIYEQIATLAKRMGPGGLRNLRDVVADLTDGPSATQFTPRHRRYFARLLYKEGVMSRDHAAELGLSSTADASDEDPAERQEACLEIAMFLHDIGHKAMAEDWIRKAGVVAAGSGSHKDYHMADLAEWLVRSIAHCDPARLEVLDRFARAVKVSGGRGGPNGAATVLQLLVRLSDARSWQLAVELIDRDVLGVSRALEALIAGGADAGADPELLSAMYGELHSLIAHDDTSETAEAVLLAFPQEKMRDAANRLMSYVRTNALPSHRAPVARALEDAIRSQGIEQVALTRGLKPGHDDSSRSGTLYREVTGEVVTLDRVAERLSDPSRPDTWNLNPDDNTHFDWWACISKANVKNVKHFDSLVAQFPPEDYQKVEPLVRRAEVILRSDNPTPAQELIERAVNVAREGSWHRRLDGAPKIAAFQALKSIDRAEGIRRAREQFSKDLAAGEPWTVGLLSDIGELLELLEVDWPGEAALEALDDYLQQVLAASPPVETFRSLRVSAPAWSVDQTLCRFVAELLAFPVVDVGVAARRAIGKYVAANGKGLVALLTADPWWNPIQLEHLLASIHVGMVSGSPNVADLKDFVEGLNKSESLAVRSIAKRICDQQGWSWIDITSAPQPPVILLADGPNRLEEAALMLDGDATSAWNLCPALISPLLAEGLEEDELRSEFKRVYWLLEREYPWADGSRLEHWRRRVLTKFWLNPRAIIGREAAMRVVGRKSLSGQVPLGWEAKYDSLYPIYDPRLELHQPTDRPPELQAMEWGSTGDDANAWRQGTGASEWSRYPDLVQGRLLIGERSWFVRPEWEWPREERYRGLIATAHDGIGNRVLRTEFELTYEMYLRGHGQDDNQLIVLNDERQLVGPAYKWAAINSNVAGALGWYPSKRVPFRWLDAAGNVMVESTFWKDGWIWIKPPRFESLGEGWFVTASSAAIEAIRGLAQGAEIHLWIERRSHGQQPYEGNWHLRQPV